MNNRKIIATVFILLAVVLGAIFFSQIEFPSDFKNFFKEKNFERIEFPAGIEIYFKADFYSQFGSFAIALELFVAGIHLFTKHRKANFTLALFGYTALLDPFFNIIGLFTSMLPIYAMIVFSSCAIVALWLAFSNTFQLRRISFLAAFFGFILGTAQELFFNYL
ncbi:MAG: hypothetical protein OEQ81_02445 [Flavobacteriaceae bacterium]|nr:hypothetical protein [Flavobacteriaceae bacterium]